MCAQCVAAGSAYVVPAVVGLKVWSSRRTRPRPPALSASPPEGQADELAGGAAGGPSDARA